MTNEERTKDMASKLFEAIAIRVDQFFKAKNIQGGVRCGDDLFSPMDKHELTQSLLAYAEEIRREERDKFREVLVTIQEAMTERRLYADMWEYKYGQRWDHEDALIKAAIMGKEAGK